MATAAVVRDEVNGVDVTLLAEIMNAIKVKPELAQFTFRVHTEWQKGGRSRTQIQGFYGAGREDDSRREPFYFTGDEPPVLVGENQGPNAVETVLAALGSCLAVGVAYNAAARDIKIDNLTFDLEAGVDLHGFLGLAKKVRPGYQSIQLNCKIRSEASREQLEALFEYVKKTSPVLDIICNPVPVTLELEDVC